MRQTIIISAAVLLAVATPALANGCNGVVSQLEWGCAAWDNNNGPQFPHFRGAASTPKVPAASSSNPGNVYSNGNGIISTNGTGIMGNNGANIVGGNTSRMVGGNNSNGH